MPYTAYPGKDAAVLVKATKDAAALVKANMNPLKSSDLKKKLNEAGLKLKAKIDLDIAGVRKNANAHFLNIENLLTQCSQYLKASKDAYAKWQSTQADKDKDLATYAEGIIQRTFLIAKQDAKEYGESWFELRSLNTGVDAAYSGAFNTEVGKLITEGKSFTSKVEKMDLYAKEAAALKKLVLTQHLAPALDIEDHKKNSEELLKEIDDMSKKMSENKNAFSAAEKNASSIANYAKNKAGAIKATLKNIEDIQVNLLTLTKRYLAAASAMKKVYDLRLKAFTPEDAKNSVIKDNVAKAKTLVTTADTDSKRIETLLKTAVTNMTTIRVFFKK